MGSEVEVSEPLLSGTNKISTFPSERVPEWKDQITIRGLAASAMLGTLFCIITQKLNLTVGIIPSLNVAAGLLGFFFVKSWTGFWSRLGFQVKPFTKQENTVIQTCVVACYAVACSGGFGSYLIAMDERTYNLIGVDYPGNRAEDVKNPGLLWMIGFLFVVSFIGLFSLVPLCKVMIMDYKLTYPSGTATAGLINSFHTNNGAELAGYFPYTWGWTIQLDQDKGNVQYRHQTERPSNYDDTLRILTEQRQKDETFLKDRIPSWFAASGYVGLAAISTATLPVIYPPLKWYLVLCSCIIAPALAFCNSYGTGLTDCNLASTYGKISLFIIASLVGSNGGVLAGLAACGVMMSIVSSAADLMQDFKTGYLTLSSAKSMFVSQLVGTAMGCVIAPLTFWLFWTAFDIGSPDGPYKAPYAVIFREMAILGVEGFSQLPKHCLALCCGFFAAALVINLLRDVTPKRVSQFIPIPMAMAIPFYLGAYFAVDMFIGTVILYIWERINRKDAEDYAGAVASGLICGDGIWTLPSAILSIFRINPPICMYFGPSSTS
ncbi:hypothetical protein SLEP1_g27262 [Rubroshorea leprosula]|uniref:Metal-nicotianamine transporter YSL6 n=1 Tax=Rubroshorea leprosula TaxID=152421 RepID=A0AAV5JVX0_9ROSI|nr:hypothetical protein SLEP1_g27262 [Rubroshorea leprosula]